MYKAAMHFQYHIGASCYVFITNLENFNKETKIKMNRCTFKVVALQPFNTSLTLHWEIARCTMKENSTDCENGIYSYKHIAKLVVSPTVTRLCHVTICYKKYPFSRRLGEGQHCTLIAK